MVWYQGNQCPPCCEIDSGVVSGTCKYRKDSLNFEHFVIEARTLEEVFGKQAPVQIHVQQVQNAKSALQALVKKVEELEGMIKKKQTRPQLNQRK